MMIAMTFANGFDLSQGPKSGNSLGFFSSFRNSKEAQAQAKRMSLSDVKLKLELAIQDLQGTEIERLRYKIRGAREVRELWMLRSDVHQQIAKQQNQQQAAEVINALLPCFEGWLPAAQLSKI